MEEESFYISITGLRVKRPWYALRFWWHAIASMRQARLTDGNILAETRTINGTHHTLSAWRDKSAMRVFLTSGAHKSAMKVFPRIAIGKTMGFSSAQIPDWGDVQALYEQHGREV